MKTTRRGFIAALTGAAGAAAVPAASGGASASVARGAVGAGAAYRSMRREMFRDLADYEVSELIAIRVGAAARASCDKAIRGVLAR